MRNIFAAMLFSVPFLFAPIKVNFNTLSGPESKVLSNLGDITADPDQTFGQLMKTINNLAIPADEKFRFRLKGVLGEQNLDDIPNHEISTLVPEDATEMTLTLVKLPIEYIRVLLNSIAAWAPVQCEYFSTHTHCSELKKLLAESIRLRQRLLDHSATYCFYYLDATKAQKRLPDDVSLASFLAECGIKGGVLELSTRQELNIDLGPDFPAFVF